MGSWINLHFGSSGVWPTLRAMRPSPEKNGVALLSYYERFAPIFIGSRDQSSCTLIRRPPQLRQPLRYAADVRGVFCMK